MGNLNYINMHIIPNKYFKIFKILKKYFLITGSGKSRTDDFQEY